MSKTHLYLLYLRPPVFSRVMHVMYIWNVFYDPSTCASGFFLLMFTRLGGGFEYVLVFNPLHRQMISHFDYGIFFKWVGSTTNYRDSLPETTIAHGK